MLRGSLLCMTLFLSTLLITTEQSAAQRLPEAFRTPLLGIRGVSRDKPYVGDLVYVWGVGLDNMKVTTSDGETDALDIILKPERLAHQAPDDPHYLQAFRVISPGEVIFSIDLGSRIPSEGIKTTLRIEAQDKPEREKLVLEPGLLVLDKPITLKPNTHLIAHGVTIDGNGGHLFNVAPGCIIDGGTYRNFNHIGARGEGDNLLIVDAHFIEGKLGHTWSRPGLHIKRSTFNRTHLNFSYDRNITIEQCYFEGVSPGHPVHIRGADQFFLHSNVFKATDRGVVYQPNTKPISNGMLFCNRFESINLVSNGNEVLLVERGVQAFTHNMNLHSRIVDCSGPALLTWGAAMHGNLYLGMMINGSNSVVLMPAPDDGSPEQTNNVIAFSEFRGGAVGFGASAHNNAVVHTRFIGSLPDPPDRRAKEFMPAHVRSSQRVLVSSQGTGNRVVESIFYDIGSARATAEKVLSSRNIVTDDNPRMNLE